LWVFGGGGGGVPGVKVQKVQHLAKHSVKHRETTAIGGNALCAPLDLPLLLEVLWR